MKPIYREQLPIGEEFIYEVKYDGFRAILIWDLHEVKLMSRNNVDLTGNFPEIEHYCKSIQSSITPFLPITLDGELVILNNKVQANFSLMQKRGRLKSHEKIHMAAKKRPATFIAFDLLEVKGEPLYNEPLTVRKADLNNIETFNFNASSKRVVSLPYETDHEKATQLVFRYKGEGVVAKRKSSVYQKGKGHHDWFKVKNWRKINTILTAYDQENDYFHASVYDNKQLTSIGKCKHGLNDEEKEVLQSLFLTEGKQTNELFSLPPAICASIHTLGHTDGELREPMFTSLLPNEDPENCTFEKLELGLAQIPSTVDISKTDKIFWPKVKFTKGDLLIYLRDISPYMLPFLYERALTIIRCPDGVTEESFFQKSLPDYAPAFIKSIQTDDKNLIVCNSLDSLIWFGNHGSIEFHVPFQRVTQQDPVEIAFDLDPPEQQKFHLAVEAALLIKHLLDDLGLISFVKTSGNKGLQIHLPIEAGSMSYQETAKFTEAVALTIEKEAPTKFTTERMKKNRKGRLYIDYVQHGRDKTLIAPYSPRMTEDGTVATPLYWEELNEKLTPNQFTIKNVVERIETIGCPFINYHEAAKEQPINDLLSMIGEGE